MDPSVVPLQQLVGRLESGEIGAPAFLEGLTRLLASQIGCTRAGIWVFADRPGGVALRCLALYDRRLDAMVEATDMLASDVGPYFEHLLRDGLVVAPDARSHPATIGFTREYLDPLDVRSILDTCFMVNGQLFGTFCCEQTGARLDWTPQQVRLLRSLAARASLALLKACDPARDTAPAPLWESGMTARLTTLIQEFDPS
jgi:GAF domain-containing protein